MKGFLCYLKVKTFFIPEMILLVSFTLIMSLYFLGVSKSDLNDIKVRSEKIDSLRNNIKNLSECASIYDRNDNSLIVNLLHSEDVSYNMLVAENCLKNIESITGEDFTDILSDKIEAVKKIEKRKISLDGNDNTDSVRVKVREKWANFLSKNNEVNEIVHNHVNKKTLEIGSTAISIRHEYIKNMERSNRITNLIIIFLTILMFFIFLFMLYDIKKMDRRMEMYQNTISKFINYLKSK